MEKIYFKILFLALAAAFYLPFIAIAHAAPTQAVKKDPYQRAERGNITPSIKDLGNGKYQIEVDAHYAAGDDTIRLSLQAVVTDGKGQYQLVELKELLPNSIGNPRPADGAKQSYVSSHSFVIDAAEMDALLAKAYPGSPGLKFSPGTDFFVHANMGGGHRWGGTERGGKITVPVPSGTTVAPMPAMRQTSIDVQYDTLPLVRLNNKFKLAYGFNGEKKLGSKLEMEGKWALQDEASFHAMQKRLMALAEDPALAQSVLPKGWTIALEDRYVLKDQNNITPTNPNGYVKDARGVPIADPMKDTATDSANFDLAKTDSIIRARHTAQNNTTIINAKPGGRGFSVDSDGIVQRIEYSVPVSGDDPANAKAFFESDHPLNFMKTVAEASNIQNPGDALKQKTVEQRANRLKFLLKGPEGQAIEVSTDHVHAKSLVKPNAPTVEYFQMEADYEHRAVNSAAANTFAVDSYATPVQLESIDHPNLGPTVKNQLLKNEKLMFSSGEPTLHVVDDLLPDSPFMKANEAELSLAKKAMIAIRDYSMGNDLVPAANKIAMSNFLLGHFDEAEASPSVRHQLQVMRAKGWIPQAGFNIASVHCSRAFGEFAK